MKIEQYFRYIIILIVFLVLVVTFRSMKKSNREGLGINIKIEQVIDTNITSKYTALIVEPRKHRALKFVLQNFFENLDDNWDFVIIHGTENKGYLNNIMKDLSKYKSRAKLINLNKENLSYHEYNNLFYTKSFYDYIPTETFLIFQTDSMILKENKNKINKFLKYDYVGAPISCVDRYNDSKNADIINGVAFEVGNGGLSLRKKSKMIELLDHIKFAKSKYEYDMKKYGEHIPEDRFFSGEMTKKYVNIYKPNTLEASEFAVQELYNAAPFGIHKIWEGIPNVNILQKMINKYPEINELINLNKNNVFLLK